MREGAPARGVPAGIGGKAAQSGEKGDEETLRVVSLKSAGLASGPLVRARGLFVFDAVFAARIILVFNCIS